jgi:hypothetical protein
MLRVARIGGACLGFFIVVASCGGASDRGASAFATSDGPDGGCAGFTRSLCQYLMTCAHVPYCNLDHCFADNDCAGFPALASALRAGATTYDAPKGAACLAAFAADPCGLGALPALPTVFDVLERCPGALTPGLGEGQRCSSSVECRGGLACEGASGSTSCGGVCTPSSAPVVGRPCVRYDDCASARSSALWCDPTSGTCAPGVDAGAACGLTSAGLVACASGLWCDAASAGASGTCRPPGGAGAPCNALGGCESPFHCVGYAPAAPDAGNGSCSPPSDAGAACELNNDCATGLICAGGACGPPLNVGERCSSNDYCRAGLTCATEKCLETRCPGEDCTDPNAWCVLGLCRAGKCQPLAATGATCVVGGDCGSGACVGGVCAPPSACGS